MVMDIKEALEQPQELYVLCRLLELVDTSAYTYDVNKVEELNVYVLNFWSRPSCRR